MPGESDLVSSRPPTSARGQEAVWRCWSRAKGRQTRPRQTPPAPRAVGSTRQRRTRAAPRSSGSTASSSPPLLHRRPSPGRRWSRSSAQKKRQRGVVIRPCSRKKKQDISTAKNSWFVEACNGISKSDMDLATLATPGIPGSANIHDNDEDPDRACCRARGAPPRSDVCALPPPVCASRGCAAATIAPRGGAQHIIEPRPAHVWRRVRGRRKVEGSWHRAAHRRRGRGKLRAHHAPSRARVALPPHHSAAFAIAHEPASIKCVIMCGQRT